MSEKQQQILESIATSMNKMSEQDQFRLEGIATGMALQKPEKEDTNETN